MKIVFMGTSIFAVPALTKLIDCGYTIVGVVSQPDRARGRGKRISPTPIKEVALAYNIPVFQPTKIKDSQSVNQIKTWDPDLIVVVSYGQIIPPQILEYPRFGCINVHASLLPRYRGAAPIQRALMAGEKESGVTTMFMNEGLDTGDIIMQIPVDIDDCVDCGELESILAEKGAVLLLNTIDGLASGSARRIKQDNNGSTYAKMLTKQDEEIRWADSAFSIHYKIRALSPAPGAFTSIKGTKVKIFRTRIISENESGVVAQIITVKNESFTVQTGEGTLEILEVQKEGKKRMSCRDFLRGFNIQPGDLLGS